MQLSNSYKLERRHKRSSGNPNTSGYSVPVCVVVQIPMAISLYGGFKSVYKKTYSKVEIVTNKVDQRNKLK